MLPCLAARPEALIEGINSTEKTEKVQLERTELTGYRIDRVASSRITGEDLSSDRDALPVRASSGLLYSFRPKGGRELFCCFRVSESPYFPFFLSLLEKRNTRSIFLWRAEMNKIVAMELLRFYFR